VGHVPYVACMPGRSEPQLDQILKAASQKGVRERSRTFKGATYGVRLQRAIMIRFEFPGCGDRLAAE
jgi:hypothetical protein